MGAYVLIREHGPAALSAGGIEVLRSRGVERNERRSFYSGGT
jgi:hypothetical protein